MRRLRRLNCLLSKRVWLILGLALSHGQCEFFFIELEALSSIFCATGGRSRLRSNELLLRLLLRLQGSKFFLGQ